MTNARARWVAALAVLLATMFLFWPLVVGILTGSPPFFEWDVPEQYWPDLVYLCENLHRGELPFWNPYDRGGYPYFADPQAGLYHPMNWALCVAGRSPPLGVAEARVVGSFTLCGLFGVAWLRRLDTPWSGAIAGGIALMAAPFMRHNWELNLTTAMAWMPAMLFAVEGIRESARVDRAAWLALAIAGCGLVGSPPALFFAGLFAGLYALIRAWRQWRWLLFSAVLAAGLLAVVLLPGAELAQHSVQAGRAFESIADKHLEFSDLLALVWPMPGNHLYIGMLALVCIPLGYRAFDGHSALMLLGGVAVAMTLGGVIFWLAYHAVPGVALFRLPHRYESWLGAIAALSFAGAAMRWQHHKIKSHPAAILGLAALAGGLLALGLGGPAALAGGVACVLAAARFGRLDHPWLGVALGAWVLLDVSQAMPANRHLRDGEPPGGDEPAARILPLAMQTEHEYRYFDEFGIHARSGTRLRHRDLRGYQDPLQLASYERVVASLEQTPLLAAQFNTKYVLHGPHFIHGWGRQYLPAPEEVRVLEGATPLTEQITELPALPFAYFVPDGAVRFAASRQEALAAVREQAPSPIAILEEDGTAGDAPLTDDLVAGTRIQLDTDRVEFQLDAPSPGVVVVNEAHYPGWNAWVETGGRTERANVVRANGFVRAIHVPQGELRIEMRFEPRLGAGCRLISAGCLVLTLALIGLGWREPRRRGP